MADGIFNVLFICTGNSARSIMAEAMLNHLGRGRFRAFSAGTHPRGAIHPMTLDVLTERNYAVAGLRSKSWTEFTVPSAAPMDFIFTVCNQAAGETCPAWPGLPITAHWDFADPAAVVGDHEKRRRAFVKSPPAYDCFSACLSTSSIACRYRVSCVSWDNKASTD